jgi:electron transfer flavoprotein alpha subunit
VEAVKPRCCSSAPPPSARTSPRASRRASGSGLATDCTALAADGGKLVATRPVFAGKANQKVAFPKTPAIVSIRPKVFAPVNKNGNAAAVEPLSFTWDAAAARAKVVRLAAASGGKPDLTESEIIVSGGRGLKGPRTSR